ncbi:MAG TPA: PKD domain-containing protein [Bacteroidia bacterium]|nr:PKD domain-containing protein [Bacteroidia bacterium]
MKTITKIFHFVLLLSAFAMANESRAQGCTSMFTYSLGANGNVTFTSTSAPVNSITTQYYWTFGNGNTYSATGGPGIITSQTYSANGVYTVSLFILTPATCSNVSSQTINVTSASGCVLNANFSANSGGSGLMNFTNLSTGTSSTSTFAWNFGDGGTSNLFSPAHTYSASGNYIVSLTVTNSGTCVSTYTANITVCAVMPSFTYTLGSNGQVFLTSTTPNTNSLTVYGWTVTNGVFAQTTGPAGAFQNYSLSVPANGTYTVSLYVAIGVCTGMVSNTISVNNVTTPTCSITINTTPATGTLCNGSATVTGVIGLCGGGPSYVWYPSMTSAVSAGGLCPGTVYTVVASSGGGTNCCPSISQVFTVGTTGCNLNASFVYSTAPNGVVNFYNTSTGTVNPVQYTWYGNFSMNNPTIPNPSATFSANGVYTVYLYVQNSGLPGCADSSVVQTITVSNVTGPCNLQASFSHTVGASGNVNFASTSSGTLANTVYFWNFGDGTTGFGINPAHIYPSSGSYFVLMTAINNSVNCVNTTSMAINVTGINCVANSNFSVAPTPTPQFWTATPAFPWNITNAVWSWGDGTSSSGLYTSHSYSAAGLYSICLNVTVSCGASSSSCFTYSISKVSSASSMIQINVVPPALVEVGLGNYVATDLNGIELYPNPNQGLVQIRLNSLSQEEISLQLSDITGRKVYEEILSGQLQESTKTLDLQALPNGIYILKVQQGAQSLSKKLVIRKD